jgi:hypothetical protein
VKPAAGKSAEESLKGPSDQRTLRGGATGRDSWAAGRRVGWDVMESNLMIYLSGAQAGSSRIWRSLMRIGMGWAIRPGRKGFNFRNSSKPSTLDDHRREYAIHAMGIPHPWIWR